MFHEPGSYTVNVIFRGLFLAWVEKGSLTVYLPNAEGLGASELDPSYEIPDHLGALEFRTSDLADRTSFKGTEETIEVEKVTKGSVIISWLNGHNILFKSKNGTLRAPTIPAETGLYNTHHKLARDSRLWILDSDSNENAFQRLVKFRAPLKTNLRLATDLVGKVAFKEGVVQSERISTYQGQSVEWREVNKDHAQQALQEKMSAEDLKNEYPVVREINLDLRVSLVADEGDPLIIELVDEGQSRRMFELGPPRSGGRSESASIDVWVKNREKKVLLAESDSGDETPPQELTHRIDLDHEAYKVLSADHLQSLIIPVISMSGHSNQGCGCGGSCGGSSGG